MSRQRLAAAASDDAVISNLDDLARLKPLVNTSRGAAYIEHLRERGIEVDDSTGANLTNLKKILAGHERFFYMNELTLQWLIREHGLQQQVKLMPAIRKLQESGELARIYGRWTGESGVRPTN